MIFITSHLKPSFARLMWSMDTHRVPAARSARLGRVVGATLITEGVLVAILRFLSLVYVVASEAYNADRFRTPLSHFLPSVIVATVAAFVLIGPARSYAGNRRARGPTWGWMRASRSWPPVCSTSRRWPRPSLAWRHLRPPSRRALTWIAIAVTSVVVIVGLVRDVMQSRARSASGTGEMTPAASIRACPTPSSGIPSPS